MMLLLKKISRYLRKSFGIFIVFFTMSVFITIMIFYLVTFRQDIVKSNECLSDKFITFNFENFYNIDEQIFMNAVENEKDVILYKNFIITDKSNSNSIIRGNGIYFNKSYFNSIPTFDGRFFDVKDSESNKPMIVVGKNLLSKSLIKGNKKYYLYDGVYYEIIGTLGYKNQSSMYDNLFILNLKSYMKNTKNFNSAVTYNLKLDSTNGNQQKLLYDIYGKLKVINNDIQINISNSNSSYNPLQDTIDKSQNIIVLTIILIIVFFCNIFNITRFWVKSRRKEIGIRKAVGGTNKNIIFRIIIEYQICSIVATCLAILLVPFIKEYANTLILVGESDFNRDTYIQSVFIIIIFSLLLGTLAALIPINQVLKTEANDIIRGR